MLRLSQYGATKTLSTGQNLQGPQEFLEFLGEVQCDIAEEVEAVAKEGLEGALRSCLAKGNLVDLTPLDFMRPPGMSYPSDLSDAEWALIEHHFHPKDRRGNASKHPRKSIVDAILRR